MKTVFNMLWYFLIMNDLKEIKIKTAFLIVFLLKSL